MESNTIGRRAVVLLFVVFLLGIVLGGLGARFWTSRIGVERDGHHERGGIVNKLTRELALSPEQQRQLAAIIDDTRARWRALYEPLQPQHEQIRRQARDRIRAILAPEQRPKFEEFLRRIDEERKQGEGK